MSLPFKSLAPAHIRTIEVDYYPPLVMPLAVDAGPNQTINGVLFGTLTGTVFVANDATPTLEWTLVSGPGTVVFGSADELVTSIVVSESGTYVFRLTASVEGWSVYDETTVTLLANPQVQLACSSESGVGTLCGYSEYTSPSTPPKKYRVQTISGYSRVCQGTSACPGGIFGHSWADNIYSGTYSYSAVDCSETNAENMEIFWNLALGVPYTCGDSGVFFSNNAVAGPSFNTHAAFQGLDPGNAEVLTQTTGSTVANEVCDYNGVAGQILYGTVSKALSDEDTEADAMARATLTPGASCIAAVESRGAGDFVFNFVAVAYDLNCTGLFPGQNYHVSVDLVEEDYGGGSPSTTTQDYYFTASGDTHQIADSINCPSGKQVTVQNAIIEFD